MTARDVSSRRISGLAWLVALAGCYDVPKPDCGFRCGPAAECPEGYTCGADNRCRRDGSRPGLVCQTPDAAPPYSPSAKLVQPANGAMLDPSLAIIVEFDVGVTNVNTDTFTVNATGSSLFVVGDVVYNPVVFQGEFSRAEGLPPNTALTVTLTSDIVDEDNQRPLRQTQFAVMTGPDTTPPTVIQSTPVNGQPSLSVATNVTVRFSEPVMNVNAATFTLEESASSTPVPAAVTFDFDTRTATLNPQDQLTPNLGYRATVTSGVVDFHGNDLAPPFFLFFSTGADNVAPSVRTTSPPNLGTNVPVNANVVVTFDEPVTNVDTTTFRLDAGAITGTVTMSNGNRTATFDPDADLPGASTINVSLGAGIRDTSNNALVATSFSFTTM